ncbi:MAG: amidase domain-containing protein [Anaerolineales bacterium]|nr:MAG: amidase domain-containing protein [Anaerolineales bacterium]
MGNNPGSIQRIIRFACAGLLLAVFISVIIFPSPPEQTASAMSSLDEGDTATPTATLENTPTSTATPTRTLISGVLTCNTVATGVTCTNYGTYLKYDININVTGLTGGATASNIFIGTYKRSTNGGWMGMMSNFIHAETSIHQNNKVFSMVRISPFDAAAVDYASFTSGAGTNVYVINSVNHWRYIAGTGNYPNTLSVRGNADYAITGYSVIGSIYLYSNQAFVTVTPTPSASATATATSVPTLTPPPSNGYNRPAAVAYADLWAHDRNEDYPNYGIDSDGEQCNDCTNYISQILEAGGIPQIPGDNDEFHWYTYQNIWGTWFGSKSWAATDWFNMHVSQFQTTRYEYYPDGPSGLSAGDFFLMDLPTNPFQGPDHSRIIVGYGEVLEGDNLGEIMLLASQHCVDRKRVRWDYNLPQNVLLWAWHVVY